MPAKPPANPAAAERQRRLAEALRANLRRRKDQAQDRAAMPDAQPPISTKPSTDRRR